MKEILLPEDDEALSKGIQLDSVQEEFRFAPCFTIAEARDILKEREFDLLILALNLPDRNNTANCESAAGFPLFF